MNCTPADFISPNPCTWAFSAVAVSALSELSAASHGESVLLYLHSTD